MECQVHDLTIHYKAFGEGQPLIVVHGRAADHPHTAAALEPLFAARPEWQRFYPDLPGYGKIPAIELNFFRVNADSDPQAGFGLW